MSNHGRDGSQHGSGRHDPPSLRSEICGPTGGTPEDLRRSVVTLRRRVFRLSDDLRQATRRADEATDLNREHVCSLESLEMMCANQDREIGHYRAEVSRLREERDTLQASLELDRVVGMEPPSAAPGISALDAQVADLNQGLDRRIGEICHLQAHIDDLARDRGNLELTAIEIEKMPNPPYLRRKRACAGLDLNWIGLKQSYFCLDPIALIADLRIVRERDSRQDQRDAEILSAQQTLRLLRSDLAAHRAGSGSDKARLQTLEGDITRARHDLEVAQKAFADRERTITENQAQIRTLSRDLGKVVRERDAVRHEYTAAFQRLTSTSATIGAPPPQTQLRLDPGSDTDQPAGGIPRSPSAETSGSEDQDADTSKPKRSRSRSTSPSPSRPQKKLSVPLEADDESMDEEDESEFDLGGGSAGGRSPSPDQAPTPPSKDVETSQSSGEVIKVGSGSDEEEGEEEENAEVADDLYEAQTLMAISQSRSEARRRDHASPKRRSVGGSGGSPGGSGGSNSDAGSRDQEANVKALQAAEPWQVIRNTLPPISFEADVGGRLGIFLRQYRDFEASELIAYWESTHKFTITAAIIAQSPWLGSFAKQRNNRISHAGNRWKRMLLTLIQAMIEGWCDLDLLLDLFFLHFPKRTDEVAWYPGIEARRANLADPQLNRREPTDLLEALVEADTVDPWRNHYRDHTADHPARHLPRLDRKFFGLQVAQPPTSS
ncbi:Hypothetical protein PHPALM_12372 [Phytophthora palmivora]|uniref:Uncharacterized protein n=1 Tax=Phytophthora palmivora TaxID=4796 RepID=A0A2P4XZY1_9STRA|nr:Hypothetical protein PHPALM_12372 [Phytophthora palmivora]